MGTYIDASNRCHICVDDLGIWVFGYLGIWVFEYLSIETRKKKKVVIQNYVFFI